VKVLAGPILVALAWSHSVFGGVQIVREKDAYRLTGAPLDIVWDATTGAVRSIRDGASGTVLIEGVEKPFDLHTLRGNARGWVFDSAPIRLERVRLHSAPDADVSTVALTYNGRGWSVEEAWTVDLRTPFAARTVHMTPRADAGTAEFDEARLVLGNLSSSLRDARIVAPYTWPPVSATVAEFANRGGDVALSCATAVTGVTVTPISSARAMALGQYWERDWNIWLARGLHGAVRLETKYLCRGRLRPGLRIPFGGQFICLVAGGEQAGLKALGAAWERLGFRRPHWSEWVQKRGLSLYSLSAKGSMGSWGRDLLDENGRNGLRNFERLQLPLVRRLGISAIWFLPLWPRGYGVSDYWSLDPAAGDVDDLRSVVRTAHEGGVRILCDLIPHGPHESSGLAAEHPEFIVRDKGGAIVYWWGCLACDYAHPGWQKYMARVAAHWVRTADIDGWRVDVAGGGRINWKPYDDYLPSWSQQWGGLGVMRRVRETLDRVKPGCLLLGECMNPPMLGQAHCIYDWGFERVLFDFLEKPPEVWVRDTRTWLQRQFLALPSGAAHGLMHFTENHDQVRSLWKLGPDVARAVWALCVFAHGFPLVYHDQEVGAEDFWAEALALRSRLPELSMGAADYTGAACSDPRVLAFVRTAEHGATVVAINFSPERRRATVTWPDAPGALAWMRRFPGGRVEPVAREGAAGVRVAVDLPPWRWQAFALRSSRAAVERIEPPRPLAPPPVHALPPPPGTPVAVARIRTPDGREMERRLGADFPDRIIDQGAGAVVEAQIEEGPIAMVWRNGLMASIRYGRDALLTGSGVMEGRERVFSEPRLFRVWTAAGQAPETDAAAKWCIRRREDGAIDLLWRRDVGPAVFVSRWTVSGRGRIDCDLSVTPHAPTGPVLGRLTAVFGGPEAEPGAPPVARWRVATVEGTIGGPFAVRHPTPRELTGRYWHPIQRLWEDALLPLDPRHPIIEWQAGGHRLCLVPHAAGAENEQRAVPVNSWLREYSPDGGGGLTLYAAGADGRNPVEFSPDRPFRVRMRLMIDHEPEPRTLQLPVQFRTEGANWYIAGDYYRVRLRRSCGGNLRFLGLPGASRPVVSASQTYTDYGILGYRINPVGRRYKLVGKNENDFEPDCRITADQDRLVLRFAGRMRERGQERNLVHPIVEYSTSWAFSRSPYIEVHHTALPLVTPRRQAKAFLAQTLTVHDLVRWRVESDGKVIQGNPESDPKGRVWQHGPTSSANVRILLENAGGLLEVTGVRAVGEELQNLFIAHDGRRYVLFFAMLDGAPCLLDARPRGVEYRLRVLPSNAGERP